MKASLFVRSYNKDFPWLQYCLKSIHKYASGFGEIVVAVPDGQHHALAHLTAEKVVPVFDDGKNGYLLQQNTKLHADMLTRGEVVVTIDSDCVFCRPVTPETFMHGDKVRWLITPMDSLPLEIKRAWGHVMFKAVLQNPSWEFMRKCTVAVPKWAYGEFRQFMEKTHGIKLDAYIMSQPNREFSEWNTLGLFLYTHFNDKIHWHDCSTMGLPEPWEFQSWSYGGLTDEIRAKLEAITA